MENKKTICIDFDGVIHSYVSGWKGIDVIPDPPIEGAIYALQVYTGYFDVCIYSSRSKEQKGVYAMIKWLNKNGLGSEYIAQIHFPLQKPPAWITIDDRCMCFNGVFPHHREIENFKPWYKK